MDALGCPPRLCIYICMCISSAAFKRTRSDPESLQSRQPLACFSAHAPFRKGSSSSIEYRRKCRQLYRPSEGDRILIGFELMSKHESGGNSASYTSHFARERSPFLSDLITSRVPSDRSIDRLIDPSSDPSIYRFLGRFDRSLSSSLLA